MGFMTIDQQNVSITGIKQIVISDIEPDEASGGYARRISFFTDDANVSNRLPVLMLMLYGGTEPLLEVQTPQLNF